MVDLGGAVSGLLPSKGSLVSGGSKIMTYGLYFFILIVILIILGICAYLLIQYMKFNRKIIIFENINGRWEQTGRDKATELKYGKAGDSVFILRKRKKYLPLPEIQTGRRTYWFAIREDGEWINIGLEDINLAQRQAKAKFLHTEMRAFRTALQSNLKDRLQAQKFMEKWGYIVVPVIVFAILGLMMYFIADKVVQGISLSNSGVETAGKVLDKLNQVLTATNNICAGGGIVSTG